MFGFIFFGFGIVVVNCDKLFKIVLLFLIVFFEFLKLLFLNLFVKFF